MLAHTAHGPASGRAPRRPQQSTATSLALRVVAGSQQSLMTRDRPRTIPCLCLVLPGGDRPHTARGGLAFSRTAPYGDKGPACPPDGASGWAPPETGRRTETALWAVFGIGEAVGGAQPLGQACPWHQGSLHSRTWAGGDCCWWPALTSLSPGTQGSVKMEGNHLREQAPKQRDRSNHT